MDILKSLGKVEPGSKTERIRAEEVRIESALRSHQLKWLKPRLSATHSPANRLSSVSYFRKWFKQINEDHAKEENFLECMISRLEEVSTSIPKNLRRLELVKHSEEDDSSDESPRMQSPSLAGRLHPAEVKYINEHYPYPAHSKVKNRLPIPTPEDYSYSAASMPGSCNLSPNTSVPSLDVFQKIYHQTKAPAVIFRSVDKPTLNEIVLKLHWTVRDTTGSRPESREGACLCGPGQRLYLFGGVSMTKRNDIRVLDTQTWVWTQLSPHYPPKGRVGHSAVYFRNQVIVYGGWSNYSQRLGVRRCYKKIYSLFLDGEPRWQRFRGTGKVPKSRRYHSVSLLGASMVVYGGVDTHCKVLKGVSVLLLDTLEWKKPSVTSTDAPGARSNCTLTAVFHSSLLQRDDFTVFATPKARIDQSIASSGFYLFGGMDSTGTPVSELWILNFADGAAVWTIAQTTGPQPIARSDHSAVFTNGYLILYGGRNDLLFSSRGDSSIRDVSLLNVTSLKWEAFKQQGTLPSGRWGHCAAVIGSRLLIMGGISTKEFLPSNMYILETDQFAVKDLLQLDNDRKKLRRDAVIGEAL